MAAQRKYEGPYRVKNIGVNGDMYEVVEMIDEERNSYYELRPPYMTSNRQAAYGKCARLNKCWQEDHLTDEDEPGVTQNIEYRSGRPVF